MLLVTLSDEEDYSLRYFYWSISSKITVWIPLSIIKARIILCLWNNGWSDCTVSLTPVICHAVALLSLMRVSANNVLNKGVYVVSTFNIGNHVYYFFRELALESTGLCSPTYYSRVARVCKVSHHETFYGTPHMALVGEYYIDKLTGSTGIRRWEIKAIELLAQ